MRMKKCTFEGALGHRLDARLHLPAGGVRAFALFAHCFTCSKDVFAAARISAALAERGVATMRFDFTGIGASEGDFAETNFSSDVEDVLAAAAYLGAHHTAPQLLIGHSLGGAAALAAAAQLRDVRAVATINAPADPNHVRHLFEDVGDDLAAHGEAEIEIGGQKFLFRQQFLDDLAKHDHKAVIARLGKALLVMHAPGDDIVRIENAGQIFAAAKHPKSFIALDGADHLISDKADAAYVADLISAWVTPYLA